MTHYFSLHGWWRTS
ncbi:MULTISPECIES: trp operon leader peptide [Cronobacter]